ncbi:DUF3786 domain-containing protein [Clostridium sp. JNZ X4-2]
MKEGREDNYEICYENLCRKFGERHPEEVAEKSGAQYDSEKGEFILTYFNREYVISYPQGHINLKNEEDNGLSKDKDVLFDKILIMSYLCRCSNSKLSNKWVPYREIKGVGDTYSFFADRGMKRLAEFFGNKGELFLKAGIDMGGEKVDFGDAGLQLNVFPKVPVILILWLADEEFEASAKILFDFSASEQVHIEDLASLCTKAAEKLIQRAEEMLK